MLQRVKDVMTMPVQTVRPDDTLQTAAQRMGDRDVGPLPVVEDNVVVGILTDRDITIRAVAAGCDPTRTMVRQAMSRDLVCCQADEDLESAVEEAGEMALKDKLPGATVLLSPACASFDQFRDYEARGAAFRAAVGGLA